LRKLEKRDLAAAGRVKGMREGGGWKIGLKLSWERAVFGVALLLAIFPRLAATAEWFS
jgi:hypothetical protein